MPEQHETLVSMQDAREEAEVRMGRARTAAKRVASTSSIVQELSDTLIAEKAVKTRGVHQAAALEHAAVKALDALNLARAELSTIQKRLEGYGRPRRLFNYFMVKWGAETRLEAEGAEWRVDEAERVYSSARAEADTAWDTMYRCAQEIGVTSSLLSKAQESHANAKRVHLALQKAAHLAADRALRTAEAVEVERSLAESVYEGCERDGRMHHPLLELSRAAACCEDGLTSDQVKNLNAEKREENVVLVRFNSIILWITLKFLAQLSQPLFVRYSEQAVVTGVSHSALGIILAATCMAHTVRHSLCS